MKKARGITTRIAAMLLSGMMVIGTVPALAYGSEVEVEPDSEQVTDVVVEDSGENNSEENVV